MSTFEIIFWSARRSLASSIPPSERSGDRDLRRRPRKTRVTRQARSPTATHGCSKQPGQARARAGRPSDPEQLSNYIGVLALRICSSRPAAHGRSPSSTPWCSRRCSLFSPRRCPGIRA